MLLWTMTTRSPVESISPTDAIIPICLSEWDRRGPSDCPSLRGLRLSAENRRLASRLTNCLELRETIEGLEVISNSYVGRIDLGPLRISINPKLEAMPLSRLFRYAYGLRDLSVVDETRAFTERQGLQDLLISLLLVEVEELAHRGLARSYVQRSEPLASPRGQILIEAIVNRGGLREPWLDCRHFERRADWRLNRVLRAGLRLAIRITGDFDLRRKAHRLSAMLSDIDDAPFLTISEVNSVAAELTRLTEAYRPSLTLIGLLLGELGSAFDETPHAHRTPGFLFDMNRFFQRLLSKFLRENLTEGRIVDEFAIQSLFSYVRSHNPLRHGTPKPRPDYALFVKDEPALFLDAKYRDIWATNLPHTWLYQLALYALASPSRESILLYACMSREASDQCIELREPISWSGQTSNVLVRPVPLLELAQIVSLNRTAQERIARQEFASRLVARRFRSTPVNSPKSYETV